MIHPTEEHQHDPSNQIAATTRLCQIITFALIQGVFLYGVIVVFMKQGRMDGAAGVLSWTAIGVCAVLFVVHLVLPEMVSAAGIRRLSQTESSAADEAQQTKALLSVFQTQHVTGCALLEGGAILAATAFLIEGSWLSIAVCAAMAGSMVARFPTVNGVRTWIVNRSQQYRMHSR